MRDSKIKNWISDRVVVPTVQSMDKRMKRIVALASLFGYLFNRNQRNKDLELRLSKTMNLAVNSNSLTLPMLYHNLVWYKVEKRSNSQELINIRQKFAQEHQQTVSTEEAQKYASVLVSLMPACLFYDSLEIVRLDIIHLFESIPFIFGESKAY